MYKKYCLDKLVDVYLSKFTQQSVEIGKNIV